MAVRIAVDRPVRRPPPRVVLERFGAAAAPEPLIGGRGTSWRAGRLVLKPLDTSLASLEWQATVLAPIQVADLRLSTPRRARDGSLVVEGWTAWPYLPGAHAPGRWVEIAAVGSRLHAALAHLARPPFMARRRDRWAVADRVAWGERPVDRWLALPGIARLAERRRPIVTRDQLIHGDLTGNVLFAQGLAPAVIDLSFYWRPARYATAVILADALVWEGADENLVRRLGADGDLAQHLIRALLFRIVADAGLRGDGAVDAGAYAGAVELACRLDAEA